MKNITKYVSAYFLDEEDLLKGIKKMKDNDVNIIDAFTPFPVHGLDKALGIRRSWLPRVGFIGGAIGAFSGFFFQKWVFTVGYQMNIGGKPFFSIPSFIPITFECTVLFAAFFMVFAFLFRSKLGLGAENKIYDLKITDDHFVVVAGFEEDKSKPVVEKMKAAGATIIEVKE
jgi:Alternative complex III, ActD subunit